MGFPSLLQKTPRSVQKMEFFLHEKKTRNECIFGTLLGALSGSGGNPTFCTEHTPARKYYIHKFLFLELISRRITFQLQDNNFLELISHKLHITYSFVIQRITWTSVL